MTSERCEARCCIYLQHGCNGAYCSRSGFHLTDSDDDDDSGPCVDDCRDYENDYDD